MAISLPASSFKSFSEALKYEWLEANGLGGWASSSVLGAHSRRYHGMLIAAASPTSRWLMLSRLDETLLLGNKRFELSCNQFPGAIAPQGYLLLDRFERDESVHFVYRAGQFVLRKSVLALHEQNSVIVSYELESGPSGCMLELRPFVAGRDIHSLVRANQGINTTAKFKTGLLELPSYEGLPNISIRADQSRFRADPAWWYRFEYAEEKARGFEYEEDLFTHGILQVALFVGQSVRLLLSTDALGRHKTEDLWGAEIQRRRALLVAPDERSQTLDLLVGAADQFLIRHRGEKAADARTIIAGYPWFGDWGRDTMIALPGLCGVTGRFDEAREIFLRYRNNVRDGIVPNRFADGAGSPEYNTVDASLWFFEAVWKFFLASHDEAFIKRELMPMLSSIINAHLEGTSFGIKVDVDGLLRAGDPSTQLTWMDAKVDGAPVTSRFGKAIEINGLWCNALQVMAALHELCGNREAASPLRQRAQQVKEAIPRVFWLEAKECFADVVYPARGGWVVDESMRPNQIIAMGLSFEVMPAEIAARALKRVRRELFTPLGLRTLSPQDGRYQPRYEGSPATRDAAYHQGTVWPWLLMPYLRAVARYGVLSELQADGAQVLRALKRHLSEGGVGSISEILDGDPPFTARGCPFQAWSVGALLECYQLLTGLPSSFGTYHDPRN